MLGFFLPLQTIQVQLQQLEGRTAGIDGQLDVTWRRAPGQQQQRQASLRPPAGSGSCGERFFFRAGESSIRWVRSVGANDIL